MIKRENLAGAVFREGKQEILQGQTLKKNLCLLKGEKSKVAAKRNSIAIG